MKVIILNHPITDFYWTSHRIYSNNLEYLGEIIKPHEFLAIDLINGIKNKIEIPNDLSYLKDYLVNDITEYSFFKYYYEFGSISKINRKVIIDFNPQAFIITSFAYCYFDDLNRLIIYLKKIKNIPIIIGGHGPSSYPDYYLQNTLCDFVVVGPAEISLKNLLDNIENENNIDILLKDIEIENVFTKYKKNRIVLNKNYYFEPFINYSNKNIIHLQLTRGCPKKCAFCSIHLISGNKLQLSDYKKLEKLKQQFNNNRVHFDLEDDNILLDKVYLRNVITYLKELFPDSTFSFENGIDFNLLDQETIEFLVKSNITQWNLSLTSIKSDILEMEGRNYYIEKFEEVLDKLNLTKLPIIVYFISGLPDDNINNIINTLFYLAEKKLIIGISNFYPVPGTLDSLKINKPLKPIYCKGTSFYNWSNLSTNQLITFFILSRFINVIKKIKMEEWERFISNKINFNENNKNLKRRELSMLGIFSSFKKRKLCYISNDYKVYEYNLDNYILNLFFDSLLGNNYILNNENIKLDRNFWIKLCKSMFQL